MSSTQPAQTPESIVQPNGEIRIVQYHPDPVAPYIIGIAGIFVSGVLLFKGNVIAAVLAFLVSLVIAFIAIFLRRELRIENGVVRSMWGLFEPNFETRYEAGHFATVAYATFRSRDQRQGNHRAVLRTANDKSELVLLDTPTLAEARIYAEVVAKSLSLPVCDISSWGNLRNDDEVDKTVAELAAVSDLPNPPLEMLSEIRYDQGDEITIEIPGPGSNDAGARAYRLASRAFFFAPIGGLVLLVVIAQLFSGTSAMQVIAKTALVMGVFAITELVVGYLIRIRANQRATIAISTDTITIVNVDSQKKESTTTIPLCELEELFHSAPDSARKSKGMLAELDWSAELVAKSDSESVSFGNWLSIEEKDYLCALMRQLIARVAKPETTFPETTLSSSEPAVSVS